MYEDRDRGITRRQALGAFTAAGLASLAGVGIKGCIDDQRQATRDGYRTARNAVERIIQQHYPDFSAKNGMTVSQETPLQALEQGQRALKCFGEVLSIPHPFLSKRRPFVNFANISEPGPDSCASHEQVADYQEFKLAKSYAAQVRNSFASILAATGKVFQRLQQRDETARDFTLTQSLSSLIPKLEVLAKRLRSGKLMVSDNVLNWSNKFGEFAEIVGQTEHYDEALAEMRMLQDYLQGRL